MGLRLLIKSLSNYSHVKLFNSHRTLTYNFKKVFRIISLNVWKFILKSWMEVNANYSGLLVLDLKQVLQFPSSKRRVLVDLPTSRFYTTEVLPKILYCKRMNGCYRESWVYTPDYEIPFVSEIHDSIMKLA